MSLLTLFKQNANNNTPQSLEASSSFESIFARVNSVSLASVAASLTASFSVIPSILLNVSSTLSSSIVATSSRYISLAISNTFSSNNANLIATTVNPSLNFSAVSQKAIANTINLSPTFNNLLQNWINKNIQVSPALNSNFQKLISKTSNVTSSFNFIVAKLIANAKDIATTFDSSILATASRVLSLIITSSFDVNKSASITKTFNLLIQKYIFDSSIMGGNSNTVSFDDVLDALLGSGSIEGTPQSAWSLTKNVLKAIPISESYLTLLINPFTKFVQLSLNIYETLNANFDKLIIANINLNISSTSVALRNINKNIQLTLDGLTNLVAELISGSITYTQALAATGTLSSVFKLEISKFNTISESLSASVALVTNFYLNLANTTTFVATLLSQSARFVSFTILNTNSVAFSRLINNTLTSTLNSVSNFAAASYKTITSQLTASFNVSNLIDSNINNSSSFTSSFNRSTQRSLGVAANFNFNIASYIAASLAAASTYTANITTLSSRLVTLAITDTFNTANRIIVSQFKDLVLSTTSSLTKNVSLNIVNNLTLALSLLTQSLRFITFSILNENTVNTTRAIASTISTTIGNVANSSVMVFRSFLTSLDATPSSSSSTNTTLSFESNFNSALTKTIQNNLNAAAQLISTFAVAINTNIALTINYGVTLLTLSLRFVSLNLIDLFSSAQQVEVSTTKNAAISSELNLLKSANIALSEILSFTTTLLTQSQRFVTFSILFNNSVSVIRSIASSISNTLETTLNTAVSVYNTIATSSNNNLNIFNLIQSSLNAASSFNNSLNSAINSSLTVVQNFNINLSSIIASSLNVLSNYAIDITSGFSRLISLATSNVFAVNSNVNVNRFDSLSTAFDSSIDFLANFYRTLSSSLDTTVLLLTQSSRFVTLSILTDYSTDLLKSIFSNVSVPLVSNSSLIKSISSSFNLISTFDNNLANIILKAIEPATELIVTLNKSITNSLQLTSTLTTQLNNLIDTNLSSSTELLTEAYKQILKFSNIETNFETYLIKFITFNLGDLSLSLNIDQLLKVSRFVTIALIDSMESSIQNVVSFNREFTSELAAQLQKNSTILLGVQISWLTNLFTQTLRFVTLAVIDEFTVAFKRAVDSLISIESSFVANIQSSISALLNVDVALNIEKMTNILASISTTINSWTLSTVKLTDKYIASSTELTPASVVNIQFNLDYLLTAAAEITTRAGYFLSLLIINTFDALTFKNVSTSVQSSTEAALDYQKITNKNVEPGFWVNLEVFLQKLNFIKLAVMFSNDINFLTTPYVRLYAESAFDTNVSKVTQFLLEFSNELQSVLQKNVATTIELTAGFIVNIQQTINKLLGLDLSTDSQLFKGVGFLLGPITMGTIDVLSTISFRFVSLSLTDLFDSSVSKRVDTAFNLESLFDSSLLKAINKFIGIEETYSISLLTQSLRFLTLSIINNYEVMFNRLVNTTLEGATEFANDVARAIKFSLSTVLGTTSNVFNLIKSNIASNFSADISVGRLYALIMNYELNFEALAQTNVFKTLAANLEQQLSLLKEVSSRITVGIYSLFDTEVLKYVDLPKALTLESTLESTKTINYFITSTIDSAVTIFTQSLRFVTLSLIPNFATNVQVQITSLLEATGNLFTNINRLNATSLFSTTLLENNFDKSISKFIDDLVVDMFTYVQKLTDSTISVGLEAVSSIQTNSLILLENTLNATTDVLKIVSSTIAFTLNNLFDTNFNSNVSYFIPTDLTVSNAFDKLIDFNLNIYSGSTTLLLTQSQRFVSLLILSYQDVAFKFNILTALSLDTEGLTNAIKNAARYLSVENFELIPQISLSLTRSLDTTLSAITALNKSISYNLDLLSESLASIINSVAITLTPYVENLIDLTKLSSVNIRFATTNLLDTNINSETLKYLNSLLTAEFDVNKGIAYSMSTSVFSSISLLTQSLNFVYLNLFESFTTSDFSYSINKFIDNSIEYITEFNKIINTALAFVYNNTIDEVRQTLLYRDIQSSNTVSSSLLIGLFRNIDSSLNLSFNQIIERSTDVAMDLTASVVKSSQKFLDDSLLLTIDFSRVINTLLNNTTELITTRSAIVAKYLTETSNFVTTFVGQSLRFVTLQLIDAFQTSEFSYAVNKFMESTTDTLLSALRETRKFLNNELNLTVAFNRLIDTILQNTINLTSSFAVIVDKYIISTSTFVASFVGQSLIFVVLRLIDTFETTKQNTISTNYNVLEDLNVVDSRSISRFTEITTEVVVNVTRISSIILSNITESFIEFNKQLSINIDRTTNLFSLISTQSLRFVSLSIIDTFELFRGNELSINLNNTLSLIANIENSRTLIVLLEVLATLVPRRAHTLYSALTTFAVDKSQPGSEGSAQTTQRTTGGSARKRNNKNTGSTFFKRGNTDDLE